MKTLSKILTLTTVTLAVMTIAACDKKNQNPSPVYSAYQNCVNCGGVINGIEFFRAQSKDFTNSLNLNLGFVGSNTVAAPYYNQFAYSPVITYSGPVAVTGTLDVAVGSYSGGCMLQPGRYVLSTLQAGTWSNAGVRNLRIQAYGPTNMILSVPQAQVSAKSYNQMGQLWSEIPQIGRLFGNVIIENVNGYRCYSDILVE